MKLHFKSQESVVKKWRKERVKIMCDYCEGNKPFKAEYSAKGIHTMKMNLNLLFGFGEDDGIAHIKDGILFADTSSGEYAELGFKINYCPMCGKKMEGKE